MWDHLKDRFGKGDFLKIACLKKQISNFSQGILSVNEYFSRYKSLWDQLHQFRPIAICEYVPDARILCPATLITADQLDQDYIMGFLIGLNENFEHVRTQILMLDPLPTMSRVMYLVSQHER